MLHAHTLSQNGNSNTTGSQNRCNGLIDNGVIVMKDNAARWCEECDESKENPPMLATIHCVECKQVLVPHVAGVCVFHRRAEPLCASRRTSVPCAAPGCTKKVLASVIT